MSKIELKKIIDYNSLYNAYERLKNEGDKTSSDKNAKRLFGQNIDCDGNKTIELWELMQKANEAQNKIIFDNIKPIKNIQNKKYSHISDDNPIHIILSAESRIMSKEIIENTYQTINEIIIKVNNRIEKNMRPEDLIKIVNKILTNDLKTKYKGPKMLFGEATDFSGGVTLLSQGLSKRNIDCDTGSFIYFIVAHELNWPLQLVCLREHMLVRWKKGNNDHFYYETTNGGILSKHRYKNPKLIYKSEKNKFAAQIYSNCGITYWYSKQYDLAVKNIKKAIDLDPSDAGNYSNLGCAYYKLKKYDNAIKAFNSAIKLDPNNIGTYMNHRGNAYHLQEKYELAIKDYTRVIKSNPTRKDVYSNRANSYYKLKKYKLALNDLTKAIELYTTDATVFHRRAQIYIIFGEKEKAKEDMQMYNAFKNLQKNFKISW